jgi:hypothetical protein
MLDVPELNGTLDMVQPFTFVGFGIERRYALNGAVDFRSRGDRVCKGLAIGCDISK